MDGLNMLRMVPFTDGRVPNPNPAGDLSWQAYQTVRNALVVACRQHGPTGPMGVVRITDEFTNPYRAAMDEPGFWERGDPEPAYWIVSDQYNHERYCYAELHGTDPFTVNWLAAVVDVLRTHDGWGLGVMNVPGSYLLVFGDRLLVNGRLARCRSAAEVVETARRLLRRGDKRWWRFWR